MVGALPCVGDNDDVVADSSCDEVEAAYSVGKDPSCDVVVVDASCHKDVYGAASASSGTCDDGEVEEVDILAHPCF